MAKIPDVIDLFAAGRAPRPTNPRLRPGPGEVISMPERPPPISRDPWFDELQKSHPSALFVWAETPGGKKVRLDGPYYNDRDATQALEILQKRAKPNSGMRLSIGPGAE